MSDRVCAMETDVLSFLAIPENVPHFTDFVELDCVFMITCWTRGRELKLWLNNLEDTEGMLTYIFFLCQFWILYIGLIHWKRKHNINRTESLSFKIKFLWYHVLNMFLFTRLTLFWGEHQTLLRPRTNVFILFIKKKLGVGI